MAEYIDIDAQVVVTDTRGREHETTVRHIFEMNKGVYTAADVVEVVRCKDCKHWARIKKDYIFASCDLDALVRLEDFYCAYGKKREES